MKRAFLIFSLVLMTALAGCSDESNGGDTGGGDTGGGDTGGATGGSANLGFMIIG